MTSTTFPTDAMALSSTSTLTEIRPSVRADVDIHAEADGSGLLILGAGSDDMKSFSFGPYEFLMVRSLTGANSIEEIHASLVVHSGLETLTVDNVKRLIDWLAEMDLLASAEDAPADSTPAATDSQAADADLAEVPASIRGRSISRRIFSGMAQAACVVALIWGAEQALEWQYARSQDEFAGQKETATGTADLGAAGRNEGLLVSEFDGVLSELFVRDGDKVQAGEILASIDNLQIRKVLTDLRASLTECQELRDEAYAEHDWAEYRLQVLHMAKITEKMGQLRFEEEVTQLRAPHAGVIRAADNLSERLGKVVASGQTLMSVERADLDQTKPYLVTSSVVH